MRIRRGVTQWALHSSEFAPEIGGMDAVLVSGGTAVAEAQPEDPDLCTGRPIVFHLETTPPAPPDRLHPGQPDSARPGIAGQISFQSPSVLGKNTSQP